LTFGTRLCLQKKTSGLKNRHKKDNWPPNFLTDLFWEVSNAVLKRVQAKPWIEKGGDMPCNTIAIILTHLTDVPNNLPAVPVGHQIPSAKNNKTM
jgi:hypothetical protein